MIIGLFLVLLDLGAIGGLIFLIVVTALRLRPSRLARPGVAPVWRWISLIALVAALGLVIQGNVWLATSPDDQGSPTTAQVEGTWTGGDSTTVRVLPDGTFTAAGLPADPNDPAADRRPDPADGHGTWRFSFEDGDWYVLFTLSGGSQFQLYLLDPATTGGPPASVVLSYANAVAQGSPEDIEELFLR